MCVWRLFMFVPPIVGSCAKFYTQEKCFLVHFPCWLCVGGFYHGENGTRFCIRVSHNLQLVLVCVCVVSRLALVTARNNRVAKFKPPNPERQSSGQAKQKLETCCKTSKRLLRVSWPPKSCWWWCMVMTGRVVWLFLFITSFPLADSIAAAHGGSWWKSFPRPHGWNCLPLGREWFTVRKWEKYWIEPCCGRTDDKGGLLFFCEIKRF